MPLPRVIAIDGPAASGKSTLGKKIADWLGYLYFDTGVMYRAVTWAALQKGIPIEAERAVTGLAEAALIDVRPATLLDGRACDVLVDGLDVTWEIRGPEVDARVSEVSAYPGVRRALSAQQRRIGQRGRVVMVGRDIGTVVLPEADLKIYLDASVEERARRRFEERKLREKLPNENQAAVFAEILASLRRRDLIDSTRATAPLRPAEDAMILDSDGIDAAQVFAEVKSAVKDLDC